MATPMNNQEYHWRGNRDEALAKLNEVRIEKGITYETLAKKLDANKIWVASAFEGQQWVPDKHITIMAKELGLPAEDLAVLQVHPYKGNVDPILYRLHEVFDTYGPAIKKVIHEEFDDGNGIMSAIDFEIHVEKKEDPTGDRVIITLDGKFLPYGSRGKYPW